LDEEIPQTVLLHEFHQQAECLLLWHLWACQ
jgi:hypothetical protein